MLRKQKKEKSPEWNNISYGKKVMNNGALGIPFLVPVHYFLRNNPTIIKSVFI